MGTARSIELAARDGEVRRFALRPLTGADEAALAGDDTPLARAARMIELCAPGVGAGALTLGDFNRAILAIYAANFSPRADATAACPDPRCGAAMDVELDFEAMLGATRPAANEESAGAAAGVAGRAHAARLRPLRLDDLMAALAEAGLDVPAARRALIARALDGLEADDGAAAEDAGRLLDDEAALSAIEDALLAADGFARVSVRGACPGCGRETALSVEPMEFVLARLPALASLLDDVDRIARVYHWSEAEILALPVARRRAYLSRIEGLGSAAHVRREVRP